MKDTVRDYLPPDEPATRKNPLYRNLFDGFDKIDGKPTEAERRVRFLWFVVIHESNLCLNLFCPFTLQAQAKAAAANSEKAKQAEVQ